MKEYPFLNTQEHFELGWEALRNQGQAANLVNPAQYATDNLIEEFGYNPYGIDKPVGTDGKLVPGANLLWNTDWQKELTNPSAARREVGVNVSGGSDNTTYFFPTSYLAQQGYLITSKFDRLTTRLNLTSQLRDWLQVGLRSQFSYADQNYPTQGGSGYENVVQYLRQMSSVYPVYQRDDTGKQILDASGQPIWDFGRPIPGRVVNQNRNTLQPSNLLASTYLDDARRQRYTTSLNGFAEVKLPLGLRLRSTFGLDRYALNSLDYENPKFGNGESVGGRLSRQNDLTTSWTWNNMLAFTRKFNQHTLDLMGSLEAYHFKYETLTAQKSGFPFSGLKEFDSAAKLESTNGYTALERIMSYLGRAVYSFRDRYFLEGTVCWDGPSRFSPEGDRRWGFFPSVGASWVMSDESFLSGSNTVSFLNARTSYGSLGNNGLLRQVGGTLVNNYFPYLSLFSTGYNDLSNSGVYFTNLSNPAISWEK